MSDRSGRDAATNTGDGGVVGAVAGTVDVGSASVEDDAMLSRIVFVAYDLGRVRKIQELERIWQRKSAALENVLGRYYLMWRPTE